MNKQFITLPLTLIIGLAAGYALFDRNEMSGNMTDKAEKKASKSGPCANGEQAIAWQNPMNPAMTSKVFMKDSMGMDYIPICANNTSEQDSPIGTVQIDPTIVQNMGVRLSTAQQKKVTRNISTVGRVTFDETRLTTIHPKVDGWVDKLFIDKTGEKVKKDTMLLSFYSPQLVATQEEYLLALANWQQLKNSSYSDIREGAKRLLQSSLDRLRFFDVAEHQIKALQRTHKVRKNMHIHATAAGVVTLIGVREGARVTPSSELYKIADLSHVWVLADLYEYEIDWVKTGDIAKLRIPSLPGRDFTGRITYIYPYLDPKTRTNKVRIEFNNDDGLLKPDMFGDVSIIASQEKSGIFIPRESILITGRKTHVFVQTAPGKFEPRLVRIGVTTDGLVEILEGVKAGESIVSSGQFLIDSESSMQEAAAKMLNYTQEHDSPPNNKISNIDMSKMNATDNHMPSMSESKSDDIDMNMPDMTKPNMHQMKMEAHDDSHAH